jgi:Fe-S oxidoreductase
MALLGNYRPMIASSGQKNSGPANLELWISNVKLQISMSEQVKVPTMEELAAEGREPEILFWVGCAGSFDERAQKITQSFVRILNDVGIDFAVLGKEESCTGDPAKRAGNEFVYQMQALKNIEVLNGYNIKKIVTTCPHCFNILKNEYPQLGGNYEVIHHSTFLQQLIDEGRI